MFIEDMLVYLIPVAVFALTAICAFFLGKNKSRSGLFALVFAWAAFTAALFFGIQQATGYDGLGFFLVLIGVNAPMAAGLAIGGPVGWFRKEKTINA